MPPYPYGKVVQLTHTNTIQLWKCKVRGQLETLESKPTDSLPSLVIDKPCCSWTSLETQL